MLGCSKISNIASPIFILIFVTAMEFSAQMYEFDAKPFIEVYCKVVSKQLSLNFIVYRIYSRVGHTFLPQN